MTLGNSRAALASLVVLALLAATNCSCAPASGDKVTAALTAKGVSYGDHEEQWLTFYRAESDKPTPVVVSIRGPRTDLDVPAEGVEREDMDACLAAGISFAAINYRDLEETPIQDIVRDGARAVQFLRTKSSDWNIDSAKIGAIGDSYGGGIALWIGVHDDLADEADPDPVLRESSRLAFIAARRGQFTFDLFQWPDYFGVKLDEVIPGFEKFYGSTVAANPQSPEAKRVRADLDMCELIGKDDPPVFLYNENPDVIAKTADVLIHHPGHAITVSEVYYEVGLEAVMHLPKAELDLSGAVPPRLIDFVLEKATD